MSNLELAINQQISNFSVLYEKLHHFHWYVKGPQFFTLHEQFQADYEEITSLVDDIAERLIQIKGSPVSTLKEYLAHTTLEENQKSSKESNEMVFSLLSDYKKIVSEINSLIDLAGDCNDKVTEDLFIGILASFEKKIWFYSAFLGE